MDPEPSSPSPTSSRWPARPWTPAAYDYIAGGSWDEQTLADNIEALARRRLRPRVLVDVERRRPVDDACSATPVAMPVAIAPMAVHGLAHPDGEIATARAAAAAGVPFTMSTMSSCSIEARSRTRSPTASAGSSSTPRRTRASRRELVQRAAAAGLRRHRRDRRPAGPRLPRAGPTSRLRSCPALGNFADVPGGADPSRCRRRRLRAASTCWRPPSSVVDLVGARRDPVVVDAAARAQGHPDRPRTPVSPSSTASTRIVVSNHGARQLDRVAATADVAAGGRRRGRRPDRDLGRWRHPARPRHRDRRRARRPGRARRPADPVGPRGRRRARGGRRPWRSCARSSRSPWPCSVRRRRRPASDHVRPKRDLSVPLMPMRGRGMDDG